MDIKQAYREELAALAEGVEMSPPMKGTVYDLNFLYDFIIRSDLDGVMVPDADFFRIARALSRIQPQPEIISRFMIKDIASRVPVDCENLELFIIENQNIYPYYQHDVVDNMDNILIAVNAARGAAK
jgi:hypothetical protein